MDKEYIVVSSMKSGSFQGQSGEIYKYATMFEGEDESAEVNQIPKTPAPKAGDKLTGHIEESKWGKKFVKAKVGGGGGFKDNPERQSSIEWQSARRDAVDYCIAKSRLLFDLKKVKEAEKELSGKHIFQVALYFKGIETGATQLERKKTELPEKQIDAIDDRNDDSAKDEVILDDEMPDFNE